MTVESPTGSVRTNGYSRWRSDRDLEGDLVKRRLRDLGEALARPASRRHADQAVALQNAEVLLHVLQVPAHGFGQLIDRAGLFGSNSSEQCQPVPGEKVSSRLDAGEVDALVSCHTLATLHGLEGLPKTVQGFSHRLDLDRQRLGHVA